MNKFVDFIEQKPLHAILALFLFHIVIASVMSWIAHTSFLASLHEGNGLWHFSWDSSTYHNEAVELRGFLNVGEWSSWWNAYPDHKHVKWIALTYWLFNGNSPIFFEIFNSTVWVLSVVLIYLAVKVLSNKNTKLACLASLVLFFPSMILTSTQLLRDPIYTLGMCFAIFGWIAIYQQQLRWKGTWSIIIGFSLIILIRGYMTPIVVSIFTFGGIVLFFQDKSSRKAMIFLIITIIFLSFLKGNMKRMPTVEGEGFVPPEVSKVEKKFRIISKAKYKSVIIKNISATAIDSTGKLGTTGTTGTTGEILGIVDADMIKGNDVINFVLTTTADGVKSISNIYMDKKTGEILGTIEDEKAGTTITVLIDVPSPALLNEFIDKLVLKMKSQKEINDTEIDRLMDELITTNNKQLVENNKPSAMTLYVLRFVQAAVERFDQMRWGFRNVNATAGSAIDVDVRFRTFSDLIEYLPRAFQVSFLSPFPKHWFESGKETGRIGRIISGLETIFLYISLIACFYLLRRNVQVLKPLLPLFLFSTTVVILLGYAVPNVGAIFRMRQGLFIPFYIAGIYGLYVLIEDIKYKRLSRD